MNGARGRRGGRPRRRGGDREGASPRGFRGGERRVATAASEDRLATRRAAFARPPGARRAAGEAIGHRARDHARRPKPPSDAPRKCRRGESGATGARVPAEDAGARTPRREANSPANRDVIVGWTTAGAMVVPAEKRGGARARASDSARRGARTVRNFRRGGCAPPKWSGSKRRARGSGRRDTRRALGDARARRRRRARRSRGDRARETATGVDDGRARQRRRARRARAPRRRRAPRCVDGRRSRPSIDRRARRKEWASLPRPEPRALPLAHSPVPLEETRSGKIERRAQYARVAIAASPPPPGPKSTRWKGKQRKSWRFKNPPGFRPRVRVDGRSRLPPQVCR